MGQAQNGGGLWVENSLRPLIEQVIGVGFLSSKRKVVFCDSKYGIEVLYSELDSFHKVCYTDERGWEWADSAALCLG